MGTKREVKKQKFTLVRKQPSVFTGKAVGSLLGSAAFIVDIDIVA